jgi:hypothetical protein
MCVACQWPAWPLASGLLQVTSCPTLLHRGRIGKSWFRQARGPSRNIFPMTQNLMTHYYNRDPPSRISLLSLLWWSSKFIDILLVVDNYFFLMKSNDSEKKEILCHADSDSRNFPMSRPGWSSNPRCDSPVERWVAVDGWVRQAWGQVTQVSTTQCI